ncbi:MAG TPA: dienelactone hydrolase family protein [Euzebya sp.]|nr:dienelactone hydrolase family protein [Euzebya sp.]
MTPGASRPYSWHVDACRRTATGLARDVDAALLCPHRRRPGIVVGSRDGHRRLAFGSAVMAAATTVAGGAALGRWVLPAAPLPRPTGPHRVGTAVTVVEGPRALPVQVWYPAAAGGGIAAPLFPSPAAPAVIAARDGVPRWSLAPLGRLRGHAIDGALARDITPRGLAVIIHGWLGFRTVHADLAEQLASDGWVVLAADHVGGALVTQYPDGRATGVDEALMPPTGDPDYGPRVLALVDRFAEDVTAVLDAAAAGLSLPAVGLQVPTADQVLLIGQSTGGGAAVRTAAGDTRVAAIVGLDPWVEPVRRRERAALACPMIAVRSGGWVGNGNDGLLSAMPGVQLRVVPRAGHTDLTVLGYLTPLTRLTGLSRCDPSLPHDAAMAAIADLAPLFPVVAVAGPPR